MLTDAAFRNLKPSATSYKVADRDGLVELVALQEPPVRFAAEADAVQTFEAKAATYRELSGSFAHQATDQQ
jgi:hypothetical protein